MEYVFNGNVLKIVSKNHTDLEDWQEVVRKFPREVITDRFKILGKIKSDDDKEGRCYDWYKIAEHYRMIDRTEPVEKSTEAAKADIDYLSMMTGIELPEKEA